MTMNGTVGKIKVDMTDMTLAELDEIAQTLGGGAVTDMMQGQAQFRAMAALAWIAQRRVDPTFTFDQALQLKMSDLDITSGEAEAATPGDVPQASPASGGSTPET